MASSGRRSRSPPFKRTDATLTAASTDLNSGDMPATDQAAFNLCLLLDVFVHKSLIYQRHVAEVQSARVVESDIVRAGRSSSEALRFAAGSVNR